VRKKNKNLLLILDELNKALQLDPDFIFAYDLKNKALFQLGRYADIVDNVAVFKHRTYLHGRGMPSKNRSMAKAEIYASLSDAYKKLGNYELSIDSLMTAIQIADTVEVGELAEHEANGFPEWRARYYYVCASLLQFADRSQDALNLLGIAKNKGIYNKRMANLALFSKLSKLFDNKNYDDIYREINIAEQSDVLDKENIFYHRIYMMAALVALLEGEKNKLKFYLHHLYLNKVFPNELKSAPDSKKEGMLLFGVGKYDEALLSYERYIKDFPTDQDALEVIADIRLTKDDEDNLATAVSYYRTITKSHPDKINVWKKYAMAILNYINIMRSQNKNITTGELTEFLRELTESPVSAHLAVYISLLRANSSYSSGDYHQGQNIFKTLMSKKADFPEDEFVTLGGLTQHLFWESDNPPRLELHHAKNFLANLYELQGFLHLKNEQRQNATDAFNLALKTRPKKHAIHTGDKNIDRLLAHNFEYEKSQAEREQIHRMERQEQKRKGLDNIPPLPVCSHYEFSLMSAAVYRKNKLSEELNEAGWELLVSTDNEADLNQDGYVGAAYYHKTKRIIVIAHSGTDPKDTDDLIADLYLMLDYLHPQFVMAQQFVERVMANAAQKDISRERIFLCGHSLGAALAEVSAYKNNLHGVTFDSPGSLQLIEAVAGKPVDPKSVMVISYVPEVDIVNTAKDRVGRTIRIYPRHTLLDSLPDEVKNILRKDLKMLLIVLMNSLLVGQKTYGTTGIMVAAGTTAGELHEKGNFDGCIMASTLLTRYLLGSTIGNQAAEFIGGLVGVAVKQVLNKVFHPQKKLDRNSILEDSSLFASQFLASQLAQALTNQIFAKKAPGVDQAAKDSISLHLGIISSGAATIAFNRFVPRDNKEPTKIAIFSIIGAGTGSIVGAGLGYGAGRALYLPLLNSPETLSMHAGKYAGGLLGATGGAAVGYLWVFFSQLAQRVDHRIRFHLLAGMMEELERSYKSGVPVKSKIVVRWPSGFLNWWTMDQLHHRYGELDQATGIDKLVRDDLIQYQEQTGYDDHKVIDLTWFSQTAQTYLNPENEETKNDRAVDVRLNKTYYLKDNKLHLIYMINKYEFLQYVEMKAATFYKARLEQQENVMQSRRFSPA